MRLTHTATTFVLAASLFMGGCGFMKDRVFTPSEAEKKLVSFCLKEGELAVVTRQVGSTLWVYAPLKLSIFDVKPSRGDDAQRKVQPFSLLSIESKFTTPRFMISLDAINDVLAGEPQTYGSSYNETYTKKRQLIYQALQESFFNAEATPKETMPEFVVVMLADVTRGLATKSTFYLKDLRQYVTEAIPPDEYYMRERNEIVGREALINDMTGKNVPYADVTWPDFLAEQMKTRVKYKMISTDLPKDTVPAIEAAKAAATTLKFYPFAAYEGVTVNDTRAKKELKLSKEELKSYTEKADWEDARGRLTTIHFSLPKDPKDGLGSITEETIEAKETAKPTEQ